VKPLAYVPGTTAWKRRRFGQRCAQALSHLHEIVDEELSDDRADTRLRQHLGDCRSCTSHVESMRELKDAVARVQRSCDPELSARLMRLADDLVHGDGPERG
jgi:anti-sigma factor RsiW